MAQRRCTSSSAAAASNSHGSGGGGGGGGGVGRRARSFSHAATTPLTWRPLCARRRCSSRGLVTAIACRAKHRARVWRARVQAWERVRGWAGAGAGAWGSRARGRGAEDPRLQKRVEALTLRPRRVRGRGLRAEGREADGGERGDESGWGEGGGCSRVWVKLCPHVHVLLVEAVAVCSWDCSGVY